MNANPFQILPTDTRWPGPWHVEEGPDCLCSRCGQPILADDIAVRAWPDDPNRYSYRFHPACLGMQSAPALEEESDRGDDQEERNGPTWLCVAGHLHEDGCHCPSTGEEPPWGCPCDWCQGDRDIEEDYPVLEWDLVDPEALP